MERERRAHQRKRASTGVTFNDSGGAPLRGWLVDIGRGGCFVASPSNLTFGETIEVQLRLGSVPIAAKGLVAWTRDRSERDRPAGMGVAFTEVGDAALAAIEQLGGSEPKLSRPRTILGVAPAPRASSPLFEPPPVDEPDREPRGEGDARGSVARLPKRTSRARWIIAGGVAMVFAIGLVLVVLGRHRTPRATSDALADVASVDATPNVTGLVTTPPPMDGAVATSDAQARDGGVDAGRRKATPKPKSKPGRSTGLK